MAWIALLVAVLVTLAGAASLFLVVIGLPGTWLFLALALAIELLDHLWLDGERTVTFSWWLLAACTLFALVGEGLEFLAGALGAKHGGASRRGMVFAVVGGVLGGIAGTPFGLVIGAFVGATVGTFLGAVVGELGTPGTELRATLRPATSASIGRILGTLSKLPIAVAVWVALSVAAFVP
jgi:hypothetical protein